MTKGIFRFNVFDENILFLFTREFIHSKMLNHWVRGVYRKRNRHTPLAAWTFVTIFVYTRTRIHKISSLALACTHIRYIRNVNWLNESYADLFIWINQLNYLLRFIRHKISAKANQLSKWYYTQRARGYIFLCIYNGNSRQKINYHAISFYSQFY